MENDSSKSQALGEFEDPADTAFVERSCLPWLERAQNDDGGWGFIEGSSSRVEPTSWALLALQEFRSLVVRDRAILRVLSFLEGAQLGDGSWPAVTGQEKGSWVTSIACWALFAHPEVRKIVRRGLRWLSEEWPGDSGRWWRLMRWVAADEQVLAQNDSYCGWSWTHRTASWVEPTSYALLALRGGPPDLSSAIARRVQLAEAMLYDRMCPGGGWNCGNPNVYGVPGEPQVGPTVWALVALRANIGRPPIQQSLDWLAKSWNKIPSPAALALASIAFDVLGETNPVRADSLRRLYKCDELLRTVPVVAWTTLAMSRERNWLKLTVPTESK
jgi:hypothetical protein